MREKLGMSHDRTTGRFQRFLYLGLFGCLLFSIILRVALTLNREIDIDEFQHLHAAWMVSQHYILYKDFWENHTPLFYYLLVPLFRWCGEGAGLVLIARGIMSFTASGILAMTYILSRLDHDRKTSFLAVLVLSYMFIFVEKSIEVRPDQLVVILWLCSLWISIKALSTGRKWKFILAGFLLGIAYLFSPKALLPFAALSFPFLVQCYLRNSQGMVLRFLKIQGGYTLGFLIPVAICLAFFYHAGTLREMLNCTVLDNFTYPNIYRPTYLLKLRNICFFLLALAGLFIHLRQMRKSSQTARANQLALLLPTLFLLLVFLFLMTAPYAQSALLFVPVLAIYAAVALKKSIDELLMPRRNLDGTQATRFSFDAKRLLFFAATVAAGLIIPCTMLLLKARPFSRTNAEQFERMEYVLTRTQPADVVFDGKGAYIFRPQAYFYSALYQAIEWRIEHGEIKEDIPESLIRTNCRVVIYDERVSLLPQSVQLFLKANYEASSEPEVYLARKEFNRKD
jgi:hypothetical protein